jgi:hypothetical protein
MGKFFEAPLLAGVFLEESDMSESTGGATFGCARIRKIVELKMQNCN